MYVSATAEKEAGLIDLDKNKNLVSFTVISLAPLHCFPYGFLVNAFSLIVKAHAPEPPTS